MINYELAKSRGLDQEQMLEILEMHHALEKLLLAYQCDIDEEGGVLPKYFRKAIRSLVEESEYELQRLWGFEQDRDRHTWWRNFPGLYKKRV